MNLNNSITSKGVPGEFEVVKDEGQIEMSFDHIMKHRPTTIPLEEMKEESGESDRGGTSEVLETIYSEDLIS